MSEQAPSALSPVFAYHRATSMIDFPGRIAAVFFTSGCTFACGFCHNASFMGRPRPGLPWVTLGKACDDLRQQWADGVVITGGEPTFWDAQLDDLIDFVKGYGFAVKLDTNGARPDVLRRVLPLVDYVAMDLKCAPDRYPEFVGFGRPELIRESVDVIKAGGTDYEFRTTVIEDVHTDEEMAAIREWVRGARRYCLQPFQPRADLPDEEMAGARRTSPDRMREVYRFMQGCADEVLLRGESLQ